MQMDVIRMLQDMCQAWRIIVVHFVQFWCMVASLWCAAMLPATCCHAAINAAMLPATCCHAAINAAMLCHACDILFIVAIYRLGDIPVDKLWITID